MFLSSFKMLTKIIQEAGNKSLFGVLRIPIQETQKECSEEEKGLGTYKDKLIQHCKATIFQ